MSNYLKNKQKETIKLEDAFEDFKKVLNDKTHPDNQTESYRRNLMGSLNRLVVAADEADSVNPGEGVFGLIILSLRSIIKLKDEIIKVEVKNRELQLEIKKLKNRK